MRVCHGVRDAISRFSILSSIRAAACHKHWECPRHKHLKMSARWARAARWKTSTGGWGREVRAMTRQEVITKVFGRQLTWLQAAQVLTSRRATSLPVIKEPGLRGETIWNRLGSMIQRLGTSALVLLLMLSAGGTLHAQAQFLDAAACCKSSCSRLHYGDPMQCCKVRLAQDMSGVLSVQCVTLDRSRLATLAVSNLTSPSRRLIASVFVRNHAPPLQTPSLYFLCSLQI